jgi:hypothetical protein
MLARSRFLPLTLFIVATSARAQQAEPVECPTVEDSDGDSLGPVIDVEPYLAWPYFPSVFHDAVFPRLARVALATPTGEVFVVAVKPDRIVGNMPIDSGYGRSITFDAAGCMGQAYADPRGTGLGAGTGIFPQVVVAGPDDTVWALDPTAAPVSTSVLSILHVDSVWDDANHACTDIAPLPPIARVPMRRLADLRPRFAPPFRIVDGRCPGPGRR